MIKGVARCLALAMAGACLAPAAAAAHATIVATTPTDTSVVRSEPHQVTMRFSESVDLGPHSVQLLDASGAAIKTPAARHGAGASTVVLTLPPGLRDGTYVIAWRVTSADSHPVSGAFSFSIGAASAVVVRAPGQSSRPVEIADAISRGVAFAGLALTLGGACLLFLLWPEGAASRRGRRLLWTGVGALLAGTVAVLLLQGPYASGGSLSKLFSPSLLSFSLSTRFGVALLVRIALTVAFAALIARALRRGKPDRALVRAAVVCSAGLIATWTLTDHSRTGVQTWLGVPAASVHLLAMSLWFGGLALLAVCVLGRAATAQHVSLIPVVPRFSRLALGCFVALGVTGVYLSYRQVGSLPALPATRFGVLLLVKSAIVVVIVALAYLSRRAVGRGGPDADLARRLRRSVTGEAFLGVAVLGVTATLVNTSPSRVSYGPPLDVTVAAPGAPGSPLDLARVQFHMNSTKQGENLADVYLIARNGSLYAPQELTARLIPPRRDVGALRPTFAAAEPGHFVATQLAVPFAGRWILRLEIRTSDIDERDVDIPMKIR
jgi:copper transport protein